MQSLQVVRPISQDGCRRSVMRPRVRRWKAYCGNLDTTEVTEEHGIHSTSLCASDGQKSSQHLDAHHVDGIAVYVAGHGDMMAFMSFEGIGIFNAVDFLISVADYHRFFSSSDALFRAGFGSCVRAFGPAFGIADPTVHGVRLGCVIGEDHGYVEEGCREDKTEQQQFLHRGTP